MANEKVWTPEQREAAVIKIKARYGHDYPYKAEIDLQCELTEAVQHLNAYIHNDGVDGPKVVEFLKRNTGGNDGK